MIAGTFLSHIGLAVTEFAGKKKVFFLAAEPLTDKITWENGNRYTFRLRASTYMQVAMLMPDAVAAKKKRWAIVYPNFEYGQSAAAAFKELMKAKQPDVEFVTEQAPPLGKVDAGAVAQAIDDAKPDAIFNVLFGAGPRQVRARGQRRAACSRTARWSACSSGEPEYLDPLKDEAPVGWIVTGYPWNEIKTPGAQGVRRRLSEALERLSAARLDRRLRHDEVARRRHREGRLDRHREADRGVPRPEGRQAPFGTFEYRASDHQATMGAYVGKIALKDGKGTMSDFKLRRRRRRAAVRRRGEEAAAGRRDEVSDFVDSTSDPSSCELPGEAGPRRG